MLTGLLFAIEEAADDAARLVATLPFAGATLIEHQARQLIAAGAGQIVVVTQRQSPELLGALHRIGRRGVAVDAVRGAADAAATLHPLARVAMIADGLVTTDQVVRLLARDGPDALLVVPADEAPATLERIGGASAWAGAGRFAAQRLVELTRLPADYDVQSTLVRLVEAAGTTRLALPPTALRDGHGIERDAAALDARGRRIIAAAIRSRRGWFDRFVAATLARAVIPPLVHRQVETAVVIAATAVAGIGAAAAIATGWTRAGLLLAVAAMLVGGVGGAIAELRDERGLRRALGIAAPTIAAVAEILLGWWHSIAVGSGAALAVALALVVATTLVGRTGAAGAAWWADAPSGAVIVAGATLLGQPLIGLGLAAAYAAATLVAAIETLKRSSLARL